jgi:NuA3 HAT complex component NTO1
MQISGRAPELPLELREKRKLAKRIIKAIQPALEDAIKKESELNRKPFEKELKELDLMFENSVLSRRGSVEEGSAEPAEGEAHIENQASNEVSRGIQQRVGGKEEITAKVEPREEPSSALPEGAEDTPMPDAGSEQSVPDAHQVQDTPTTDSAELSTPAVTEPANQGAPVAPATVPTSAEAQQEAEPSKEELNSPPLLAQAHESQKGLLTPPPSFQGDSQHPLSQGGILWYMQPFDPVGTTIHEERWTGRDVMRGMSEELSELDEDELKDLVDDEMEGESAPADTAAAASDAQTSETAVKVHRTRRRWRGFK